MIVKLLYFNIVLRAYSLIDELIQKAFLFDKSTDPNYENI